MMFKRDWLRHKCDEIQALGADVMQTKLAKRKINSIIITTRMSDALKLCSSRATLPYRSSSHAVIVVEAKVPVARADISSSQHRSITRYLGSTAEKSLFRENCLIDPHQTSLRESQERYLSPYARAALGDITTQNQLPQLTLHRDQDTRERHEKRLQVVNRNVLKAETKKDAIKYFTRQFAHKLQIRKALEKRQSQRSLGLQQVHSREVSLESHASSSSLTLKPSVLSHQVSLSKLIEKERPYKRHNLIEALGKDLNSQEVSMAQDTHRETVLVKPSLAKDQSEKLILPQPQCLKPAPKQLQPLKGISSTIDQTSSASHSMPKLVEGQRRVRLTGAIKSAYLQSMLTDYASKRTKNVTQASADVDKALSRNPKGRSTSITKTDTATSDHPGKAVKVLTTSVRQQDQASRHKAIHRYDNIAPVLRRSLAQPAVPVRQSSAKSKTDKLPVMKKISQGKSKRKANLIKEVKTAYYNAFPDQARYSQSREEHNSTDLSNPSRFKQVLQSLSIESGETEVQPGSVVESRARKGTRKSVFQRTSGTRDLNEGHSSGNRSLESCSSRQNLRRQALGFAQLSSIKSLRKSSELIQKLKI